MPAPANLASPARSLLVKYDRDTNWNMRSGFYVLLLNNYSVWNWNKRSASRR